jgi:hypothetical protein
MRIRPNYLLEGRFDGLLLVASRRYPTMPRSIGIAA